LLICQFFEQEYYTLGAKTPQNIFKPVPGEAAIHVFQLITNPEALDASVIAPFHEGFCSAGAIKTTEKCVILPKTGHVVRRDARNQLGMLLAYTYSAVFKKCSLPVICTRLHSSSPGQRIIP
jgi:hypothetical protein